MRTRYGYKDKRTVTEAFTWCNDVPLAKKKKKRKCYGFVINKMRR